jgi:hypothetical protein
VKRPIELKLADKMTRYGLMLWIAIVAASGVSCSTSIQVIDSVKSPDGAIVADFFLVSGGGAAAAESQGVSLRSSTDTFSPTNDVFGAVDVRNVRLGWTAKRELEVAYGGGSDDAPTTMKPSWRNVSIRYVFDEKLGR